MHNMWLAENTGRKISPKIRHLRTIAQICRPISSTIGKWLNNNISSTRPYNMVSFGPLTAEIGSLVWASFNGFRVLASLLHQRGLTNVNQTLHDV